MLLQTLNHRWGRVKEFVNAVDPKDFWIDINAYLRKLTKGFIEDTLDEEMIHAGTGWKLRSIPIDPTTREMAPMPPTAMLTMRMIRSRVSSIPVWVVTVKSSSFPCRSMRRFFDPAHGRLDQRCGGDQHIDFMQRVAIEQLPRRGHRDVAAVVDIEPEELSLGLHQADDHEPLARDADMLPQARLVAE